MLAREELLCYGNYMTSPGANLEHLLIRSTAISLIVQGLALELALVNPEAADRVKQFALSIAKDLEGFPATGPQVAGNRLIKDINDIYAVIEPEWKSKA